MNPTVVQQGAQGAKAAYAPVQASIAAQIPAIQQLYQTLTQGLQGQVGAQQQNVLQSAQQRGVATPGLNQGIASMLSAALLPATAQLGVDTSQSKAGVTTQLGKAQQGRALASTDLAKSAQDIQLAKEKNALDMQQLERDNEVNTIRQQVQEAQAAARSAASAKSLTDMSEASIARQLRLGLTSVMGGDKHVSPKDLAKAYVLWQSAGLNPTNFWSNFQGMWNPDQGNYGDQFNYFISNPGKL